MRAAGGGIAGVVGARIGVVAMERGAGLTLTGCDVAGLGAGADVVIVAVGVRMTAVRDRIVHTARVRIAGVEGADDAVVAVERRPGAALAGFGVAGLGAGADVAVVAITREVVAVVLVAVAGVGRAEVLVVTVGVGVAAARARVG